MHIVLTVIVALFSFSAGILLAPWIHKTASLAATDIAEIKAHVAKVVAASEARILALIEKK